ncbi:MAG: hypothetical protein IJV02_03485, partial [Candidatus Methanomethylophilaceae archaeon]|nr:hypothetical protein [Candidatus Methanomethylophilaceae archaeon]
MTDRDPDNLDEFENTGNDTSIPNGSGNPTFQEQQDIYNRQRAGYGEDGRNSYGYDSEGLDQDQRERIGRDNPDDADARETA